MMSLHSSPRDNTGYVAGRHGGMEEGRRDVRVRGRGERR
jgi:hypothetical protein